MLKTRGAVKSSRVWLSPVGADDGSLKEHQWSRCFITKLTSGSDVVFYWCSCYFVHGLFMILIAHSITKCTESTHEHVVKTIYIRGHRLCVSSLMTIKFLMRLVKGEFQPVVWSVLRSARLWSETITETERTFVLFLCRRVESVRASAADRRHWSPPRTRWCRFTEEKENIFHSFFSFFYWRRSHC